MIDNAEPYIVPWTVTNTTNATGHPATEPIDTIRTGGGGGQTLISPVMTAIGQTGFAADRSYGSDQPVRTVVSKAEQCLIAPLLIQYHGEQSCGEVRGQHISRPILTVDAAPRYGLAAAFLSKYYAGGYTGSGAEIEAPLATVTAVDHNALVISHMCVSRNHQDSRDWREPMPTIMTSSGHFAEVRTFLIKYYGQGTGQGIDAPLDTIVSRDRFGVVAVHGQDYMIVDIGLRMLTPRELYNAQGFPADYIIDRDYTGRRYPKSKQVARCGNAVPPPFAEALVRANFPEIEGLAEVKNESI